MDPRNSLSFLLESFPDNASRIRRLYDQDDQFRRSANALAAYSRMAEREQSSGCDRAAYEHMREIQTREITQRYLSPCARDHGNDQGREPIGSSSTRERDSKN